MMWWYLSDLSRFKQERMALATLAEGAPWLTPLKLTHDKTWRLIFEADITVGERVFPVYLLYHENFPFTSPSVYPRGDDTARWSNHQFGAGGELCLQYRPDNWTADITGAQVLESAYQLLSAENPPEGKRQVVPSSHDITDGQRLRSAYLRLLVSRNHARLFENMPVGEKMTGKCSISFRLDSTVYILDSITLPNGEPWRSTDVPATIAQESCEQRVTVLRAAPDADLPGDDDLESFWSAALPLGFDGTEQALIILRGNDAYGYRMSDKSVIRMTTVPLPPQSQRLDSSHTVLPSKSVAIIGCGSLGSKVATMLARAGLGDFYLLDDDLLLPDNLVRHDLDWRDVGMHKVNALSHKIRNVSPTAKVDVGQQRIAGQEAGARADAALASLTRRDLIVDATASDAVLNLLSGVADSVQKPVVWAKVYGGGFGGLLARSRPEIDPSPLAMRRAIENWFL